MLSALREFVGIKARRYTLSVPRIEENEGLLPAAYAWRCCPTVGG